MSIISNFIFHKGLDGIWLATTRDNYFDLFNNRDRVLYRSRDISSLERLIEKTGGDPTKLTSFMLGQNVIDGRPDKAGCEVPIGYKGEFGEHY